MTTRILLVRHGESEWNAIGRWQGWADPDLSDLGRQQAFEAAASVGSVNAIVSSDLQRGLLQTALIISESIGVGPVVVDPDIRERDVGEWTGHTRQEIEARWPGSYEAWRNGGMPNPPGGEDNDAIIERVRRGLQRIDAEVGGEVLAVAHGGVIRLLERRHGIESPPPCPNLGGVIVDVHGDKIEVGDRVLLLDPSTDHVTAPPNL